MDKKRYLTKSRFKTACECPTKLFYTSKNEYGNAKLEDTFLKSLAEGGFQVGELAKLYFEGGYEVSTLDYDEAVAQTDELLKKEDVVIFEAAVRFQSLFVRVDVLVKKGKTIHLIEVKAKSADTSNLNFFKKKTRELDSEWESYLLDIAFQAHVAKCSYSDCVVVPYLMLADKRATASVDGLNQNFILENKNGRTGAKPKSNLSLSELGTKLLKQIEVTSEVSFVHDEFKLNGKSFIV